MHDKVGESLNTFINFLENEINSNNSAYPQLSIIMNEKKIIRNLLEFNLKTKKLELSDNKMWKD